MVERRAIRVLVPYSRTLFFNDQGRARGVTADTAGPGRIATLRKEAEKRGLDPNKWFNNVELVVAEKVGIETTTYVRNIFKYYVAYRLSLDAAGAQRKAREDVKKGA